MCSGTQDAVFSKRSAGFYFPEASDREHADNLISDLLHTGRKTSSHVLDWLVQPGFFLLPASHTPSDPVHGLLTEPALLTLTLTSVLIQKLLCPHRGLRISPQRSVAGGHLVSCGSIFKLRVVLTLWLVELKGSRPIETSATGSKMCDRKTRSDSITQIKVKDAAEIKSSSVKMYFIFINHVFSINHFCQSV